MNEAKRILIATAALTDAAVLTPGGTLADTLPVTNLQTQQPGEAARWTSLTGMYVEADLGAAQAINVAALLAHNGTAAATWRIRGATSQANLTAAPGYDTGAVFVSMWTAAGRPAGYDNEKLPSLHFIDPAQSFRFWRIDLADAANPAGFFEAGRLVIDAAWRPGKNLTRGWEIGYADVSEPEFAAKGHLWPGPESVTAREWSFTLRGLSEDDVFANGYELARKRGARKDVLIIRNPQLTTHLHRNMLYGLMSGPGKILRIAHNFYEQPYRLREFPI